MNNEQQQPNRDEQDDQEKAAREQTRAGESGGEVSARARPLVVLVRGFTCCFCDASRVCGTLAAMPRTVVAPARPSAWRAASRFSAGLLKIAAAARVPTSSRKPKTNEPAMQRSIPRPHGGGAQKRAKSGDRLRLRQRKRRAVHMVLHDKQRRAAAPGADPGMGGMGDSVRRDQPACCRG